MKINALKRSLAVVLCLLVMLPVSSVALDIKQTISRDSVSKKKQIDSNKYLTAQQAYNVASEHAGQVLFIDVRTPAEIEFVGWAPMVDAVIPYLVNDFSKWDGKKKHYKKTINTDFSITFEELMLAKGFGKDIPVIFMCRSGSRSAKAAALAAKLGYTQAYTVVDGFEGDKAKQGADKGHRSFNGWKNSGLPWNYKLDVAKILFDY